MNLWTAVSDTRHRAPPVHTLEKSEGSVLLNNTFQSSWVYTVVVVVVWSLCCCVDYSTQASLSFTISPSLLRLMSIESVMPSNHLILCHPLLLLPSIFPSIRVFSNELALYIRWSKYWSFSFSIIPFNEYSWLISFRIDWFDLLLVQGTLKSLFQHHSSKASILWCSAFFTIQTHNCTCP